MSILATPKNKQASKEVAEAFAKGENARVLYSDKEADEKFAQKIVSHFEKTFKINSELAKCQEELYRAQMHVDLWVQRAMHQESLLKESLKENPYSDFYKHLHSMGR